MNDTPTEPGGRIALGRNEIVPGDAGERVWHGTLLSHATTVRTELEAVVEFLDWNGHPLGRVHGRAARLAPGAALHLRAVLPVAAALVRVDRLRWRIAGRGRVTLGPDRAWPFGHVPDPPR